MSLDFYYILIDRQIIGIHKNNINCRISYENKTLFYFEYEIKYQILKDIETELSNIKYINL